MTETHEQYITSVTPVLAVTSDLAPIALDLVVKWSKLDAIRTNAADQDEWASAYSEQRTVEQSMRGLANQVAAQRLAEFERERDRALPVEPITRGRNRLFKTE